MATPGSERARQSALNSEDELCGENRWRHRIRRLPNEINDDSIGWDLNDDGRPKTRRVNPQRLAIRLGPELVAEMEAYIVPGAKMPPFSIRKDFQERYSVDRRHIYDYFHSRGLRVAKEDKHTNLIRGRAIKAKTLDQTFSVAQTSTREEPSLEKTFSLVTPKSTDEAVVLGRTARQTNKIRERKPGVVRRSVKPVKKTLGPVLSMPDSLSGVLSNSGGDHSISGTDTDWDSTSISPQFSLACDSSDESIVASASSNFLPSPNDFLTGFFGTPDHLPHIFLGIEGSSVDEKLDSFISVDQEHLLTQGERSELYDLISGSISSSVSIDDGQPSDTLLSVDNSNNRGGRLYHQASAGNTYPACNTCPTAFETAHSDSHDLKTWLSDDLDLQQSVMDTNFFSSLRDSLDGYAGFYDASLVPIVGSCFGMTGDYHQAAALSPQNRLPSSKVPISIPCVKQHIVDHVKKDAENIHPGTYFNSR